MKGSIQLLPDHIANQIAAGEVIQRPASVVKELMENAVDAGATKIKLVLKDAGKTLVQVIDDGKGMNEVDARMSFERHATSKILKAEDLFAIKTMGFRGEALASIAAIAMVELITKPHDEELANHIIMEGSQVKTSDKIQSQSGTSISVKNLFFNIPARRKFLKSDPVELRHALEEFIRIALAHPEINFSCFHNGNELYHLISENLKLRIINVMNKSLTDKLLPIQQDTNLVNFSGFVSKPEYFKKTSGDQYLFVNKRYIKSPYLNHAIRIAYEELLPKDHYPTYVLFMDINPDLIDINVHPTKTEIKFEEERLIYNYLKVAVKQALGQFSLAPLLDFDTDTTFQYRYTKEKSPNNSSSHTNFYDNFNKKVHNQTEGLAWQDLYKDIQETSQPQATESAHIIESEAFHLGDEINNIGINHTPKSPMQWHNTYLVSPIKSGLLIIDQQAAHERILYEGYRESLSSGVIPSQKELFPQSLELSQSEAEMLKPLIPYVNNLGFDISEFGHNTFVIHGTPSGMDPATDVQKLFQEMIHAYAENKHIDVGIEHNIALSLAKNACIKKGKKLETEEMSSLVDALFACKEPFKSPSGKKCFITLELDEILKRF